MSENMILSGASVFLVADLQRSADYYRDALGFRYDRFWGEPPCFCMVWRNQQCIMLSQVENSSRIRPVSSVNPSVWDAYFWVRDVEAFFTELRDRGARFKYEPLVKPYGVKEFAIVDPDEYVIAFGQELEEET